MKPPIVMVGYIRRATLERSLLCLSQCRGVADHEIYLYLDAPYCSAHQLESDLMVQTAVSFRAKGLPQLQVLRRRNNLGIPQNHILAVSEIIEKFGCAIFFEDDVCVSHTFLEYMDEALARYADDSRIFCINAFFPTYMRRPTVDLWLQPRLSAWGCGLWANRWRKVDFNLEEFNPEDLTVRGMLDRSGRDLYNMCCAIKDGSLRTWDAQCTYYMATHGLYAVTPRYSLTKNIGYGKGLHCMANAYLSKLKYYDFSPDFTDMLEIDTKILKNFLHRPRNFCDRIAYALMRIACHFVGDEHYEPCQINGLR